MTIAVLTEEESSLSEGLADTQLLTERDIVRRSGLPGPLVEALLHSESPQDIADYHTDAPVYSEDSVYRAQLAVLMLNVGIRWRFICAVMREPRTAEQLGETITMFGSLGGGLMPGDQTATLRQPQRARFDGRLLAAIRGRRGGDTAAGRTVKATNGAAV